MAISTTITCMTMTVCRHVDLWEYVRISYRAADIAAAIFGFLAAAVFAMLYAIIMNRRIVGKVTKKIICKR